jgi:hypothetical protein
MAVTIRGGSGPGTYQWFAGGSEAPLAVKAGERELEVVEFEPK